MPRYFPDPLVRVYDTAATSNQIPKADANGDYAPGSGGGGGISDGDTLSTGLTFPNTGLRVLDTNASHDLVLAPGSDLTGDRTLTLSTGDADRTLTMSGNATISGTNTGDQTITLSGDVSGSGTGAISARLAVGRMALISAGYANPGF